MRPTSCRCRWARPRRGGVVGSVRLQPGPASITLRVPLPQKLPFQVSEQERALTLRLYGVASDINWMQYGGTDPLVTRMSYAQPAADEVTITVELARRVNSTVIVTSSAAGWEIGRAHV